MKISDFSHQSVKQTIMDFTTDGYKIIGRGASALVLRKENSDVIKIGSIHDGWLTFAKACEGTVNPYLPKVKSLQVTSSYYVAAVEFLQPVARTFQNSKLYKQIAAYMYLCGRWENARIVYLGKQSPDQIKTLAKSLFRENPELVAALKIIIAAKGDLSYDLHPDNLMKRLDGSLVLNDPLTLL